MADSPSPALQSRDLPEPPSRLWPLIGPGVVAAGVGLASGEFILWPYIAAQVGLTLLWGAAIGGLSLFAAALGIVDYTSRIGADVLKSVYLRNSRHSESRIYFALVWGLVSAGCAVLLLGVRQPLVLLVISSVTGGLMMCIYSTLLIVLNRRELPAAIRITRIRIAALVWATLLFGFLAVLTFNQQIRSLFS